MLLQMRHVSEQARDVSESPEPVHVAPSASQTHATDQSAIVRWNQWQRGAYAKLGLDGLARMAWARHDAGIKTDKLDNYAMERVTREECKW